MSINTEAILSLFAGTVALLVFGSIYTFGTLTPYIYSYLHYKQNDVTASSLSILFTLTFVTINLGIAVSSTFFPRASNRILCLIALIGMSASVYISSYMESFIGYVIFYGFTYGISIGFGYYPPLKNCYLHLPKRKGLCSGICMSGFGLGSGIFNYLLIALVNPNDEDLDKETKLYPQSVANNLPRALRYLAVTYFAIGIVGVLLIKPPKDKENKVVTTGSDVPSATMVETNIGEEGYTSFKTEYRRQRKYTFKQLVAVFMKKKAYFLVLQFAFVAPFGMFTAFNYKRIAFDRNSQYFTKNDHLVTTIGSVGIFCNGIFRSAWGFLFDHFSFRKLTFIINLLLLLFCIGILFAVQNVISYFIIVPFVYLAYGGLYAILPTQAVRVLGPVVGSKIFWMVFSGFTFAAIIQFVTQFFTLNYIKPEENYYYCLGIFLFFNIIGLIIGLLVKYDYQQEQEKLLPKYEEVKEEEVQYS